jgi:hypothetical protein
MVSISRFHGVFRRKIAILTARGAGERIVQGLAVIEDMKKLCKTALLTRSLKNRHI